MAARSTFLFYHTGAIGDFITILPVVKILRQNNPAKHFVLLGRPQIGILGLHRYYFDEVIDVSRSAWSCLFAENTQLPAEIETLLGTVHTACLWTNASEIIGHLKRQGIPRLLSQAPFPDKRQHILDYHLELFTQIRLPHGSDKPEVYPDTQDRAAAAKWVSADKHIAIHPGSGSSAKNWPVQNFLALAKFFGEQGYRVLWITGPAESEDLRHVSIPNGTALPSLPLNILAAVLQGCKLFIGNDSGISHLAAAVGTPCLCLFGPSDPVVWAPRGKQVHIIQAPEPDMSKISLSKVLKKASAIFP